MFAQDILTRIINVNWPGDLIALEFFITSTWQPPNQHDPANESNETIDDTDACFECGNVGVHYIGQPFPPDVGAGFAWKKQARWDVVLGGIYKGKFDKNAVLNGIQGVYEWEATGGGEVITGGLTFQNGHDPPGNFGAPDPSQNFEVWHPPGFPRTKIFDEWEVLAGNTWAVKFDVFSGGDFLDSQGRRINTPSFGFGGGINTRPGDGVFKGMTEATGLVKGVEFTGQFDGHDCWTHTNWSVLGVPPHGYEYTEADFPETPHIWENLRGCITKQFPTSVLHPLSEVGDDIDTSAVECGSIRLKRSAESTVVLVPVAVGGNKDFVSVLMGIPPPT